MAMASRPERSVHLQLDRPPIVEAMVDIDCEFAGELDMASVELLAQSAYGDDYPVSTRRYSDEFLVERREGAEPSLSTSRSLLALQFRTSDATQLVQVRAGGFSFNRLAPYAGFDVHLPEVLRGWAVYRSLVSPSAITRLSLRYINRLLLPMPGGTLDLDAYLTIAPRVPDETRFHIGPFVVQAELGETGSNCAAHFVLASQPPEDGYFPVLLDITTQLTAPLAPNDDAGILERLLRLRHLKNRIFHQSLTDTCRALYR